MTQKVEQTAELSRAVETYRTELCCAAELCTNYSVTHNAQLVRYVVNNTYNKSI